MMEHLKQELDDGINAYFDTNQAPKITCTLSEIGTNLISYTLNQYMILVT